MELEFDLPLSSFEQQVQQLQTQINELTVGIEAVKADNVKLYEKIRYLQSYKQDHTSTTGETIKQRAITIHSDDNEEEK